jgi:hypothetical protein
MKTKIVPASELNPEKSLRAEDYIEKVQFPTAEEVYKRTRPYWCREREEVGYLGGEGWERHNVMVRLEFTTASYDPETDTVIIPGEHSHTITKGVILSIPESRMFDVAPGGELPRWILPEREAPVESVEDFTVEQLRAAHEFTHVESENDQLAVCAMAHTLHHVLGKADEDALEHLLNEYLDLSDEYGAAELKHIFEDTIREGKV